MKKFCKKNSKVICFLIAVVLIYVICLFAFGNKNTTIVNKPYSNLLTKKVRLEDDFYDSINYEYLKTNNLKDDEMAWYYMLTESGKKIKSEKIEIIENILNKCNSYNENSNYKKICIYYDSYMNNKKNNTVKSELEYYFNLINNVKTPEEFINLSLNLNKELSIDLLVNPHIDFKPDNLKKAYFSLGQIYYDKDVFNSEYYSLETFGQELNKLKKYDVKLLKLYGLSENDAYKLVSDVQNMYEDIARFSIKSDKILDKGYKVYNINDLQKELKNINLNKIINKYNDIYTYDGNILVVDINQLKAIDNYLVEENLDTLKKYGFLKIITAYSDYLGDEYYKLNKKFEEDFYGIEMKFDSEKEFVYYQIYNLFMDTITYEFSNKHFTNKEKEFYTELIKEEIKVFKDRINNEDWLSNDTKKYAIEKMDKIKFTVGVSDNLVFVEKSYDLSNNYSYLKNIININYSIINEYNKQYKTGNILYGQVDYLDQNAYYEANTNSINLLLGMIYSYKYTLKLDTDNLNKNYYEILGTVGFTIGHELTHALDSNGCKYDAYGNYINWWTKEDLEAFNKLNISVVKYYNNFEQFGSSTLGENIADLGAMRLIMDIAKLKKANDSDYKKIFENYALDWCSQMTPYANAYLLYNDVHSPNKNRTNAVLSSTDEFYKVYDIKETDDMFIAKKDRVFVW